MSRYLVTGAAGFIGRSIAADLVAKGHQVRGVDNFITGKRSNLNGLDSMEFFEGDLCDPAVCARACRGVEVIFHEAAIPSVPRSVKNPIENNRANVDATLNLLLAAREASVRRLVYAGSSAAYGDSPESPKKESMLPAPISPYAVGKLAGEYYMQCFARVYGLETVVLRYFNVFGAYQDPTSQYSGVLAIFIQKMLSGERPTIFGDGYQTRDFTYIANVVNANLLAATAPADKVSGRVFNAATGTSVSLNETYALLSRLIGYSELPLFEKERTGDIRHSAADISLATASLGYRPLVDFESGLARTVDWYKSQPK
jgi:UDP-glucose 4-epimerase